MKQYILTLFLIILICPSAIGQKRNTKKGKTAVVKVVVPQEDFSEWTNNPICKVLIIDSLTTKADEIIQNLPIPAYMGKISGDARNFNYENELGNIRLSGIADKEGNIHSCIQTLVGEKWDTPTPLNINGDFIETKNAFIMPDGQTLYFAARSNDDNEGKTFSIYTTMWDAETQSYLRPQRLPYPFYSADADDFIYIEDEISGLAWLVTDRRLPTGFVCAYSMKNAQPWQYYDSENTEGAKLKSLALIEHYADTHTSADELQKAKSALNIISDEYKQVETKGGNDYFVINNNKVCRSEDDFTTIEGRFNYKEYKKRQKAYESATRQLNEYRLMYAKASSSAKDRLKSAIIELEKQQADSFKEMKELRKQCIKAENMK